MKTFSLFCLLVSISPALATADEGTNSPKYGAINLVLGAAGKAIFQDPNLALQEKASTLGFPGPSRISGGTEYRITFQDAEKKPVALPLVAVFLYGFSESGQGKVLVRSASGTTDPSSDMFHALSAYSAINPGMSAHELGGNVLLASGEFVAAKLPTSAAFRLAELDLTLEGYTANDATAVVQLVYTENPPANTSANVASAVVNAGTDNQGGSSGRVGGSQCTTFGGGCSFPDTCKNGWCIAPSGGGSQCSAFGAKCTFPDSCKNGWCVSPSGAGSQCSTFGAKCSCPFSCKNGWCVR